MEIKTKYKPNDKVYFLDNGRPSVSYVNEVIVSYSNRFEQELVEIFYNVQYTGDAKNYSEEELFFTIEELKQVMIKDVELLIGSLAWKEIKMPKNYKGQILSELIKNIK